MGQANSLNATSKRGICSRCSIIASPMRFFGAWVPRTGLYTESLMTCIASTPSLECLLAPMQCQWSCPYSSEEEQTTVNYSSKWNSYSGPPAPSNASASIVHFVPPSQDFPFPPSQLPASAAVDSIGSLDHHFFGITESPPPWNEFYPDVNSQSGITHSSYQALDWFPTHPPHESTPNFYPFSSPPSFMPEDCHHNNHDGSPLQSDTYSQPASLPYANTHFFSPPQDRSSGPQYGIVSTSYYQEGLIAAGGPDQGLSQSPDRDPQVARIVVGTRAVRAASEKKRKHVHRFNCPVCFQGFTSRSNEQRHLRAHYGIRPFKCSCGSAFTSRCDLLRHLKTSLHPAVKRS